MLLHGKAGLYLKIRIEYSFNSGYTWITITNSVDASSGKYFWTLPNSQATAFLVRVSDISNSSVMDSSDKSFSIYIQSTFNKAQRLNKTTIISSTAVKIMPLGDSITEGQGDDPTWDTTDDGYTAIVGYRERLFNLLTAGGYKFRFVGNVVLGYDNVPSNSPHYGTAFYNVGRYNEGHGGWVADGTFPPGKGSIEDNIGNWLTTLKNHSPSDEPDIILLMAGTNDLGQGDTPSIIEGDILRILSDINSFNSNTKSLFAKLIYYHLDAADLNSLNSLLQNDGGTLPNTGKNVTLVDQYSALPASSQSTLFSVEPGGAYQYHDIHPNGHGYDSMAGRWYDGLKNYLPLIQLRIFLQGPYTSGGMMTTTLRDNNLIPTTSPYQDVSNNSQFYNSTTHKVVVPYSIPSNITDWVQIEIRSNTTNIVESKSCFLRKDGQVIDPDGLSDNISIGSAVVNPNNTYYIVVKHRNHLAVMSSDALS